MFGQSDRYAHLMKDALARKNNANIFVAIGKSRAIENLQPETGGRTTAADKGNNLFQNLDHLSSIHLHYLSRIICPLT